MFRAARRFRLRAATVGLAGLLAAGCVHADHPLAAFLYFEAAHRACDGVGPCEREVDRAEDEYRRSQRLQTDD